MTLLIISIILTVLTAIIIPVELKFIEIIKDTIEKNVESQHI